MEIPQAKEMDIFFVHDEQEKTYKELENLLVYLKKEPLKEGKKLLFLQNFTRAMKDAHHKKHHHDSLQEQKVKEELIRKKAELLRKIKELERGTRKEGEERILIRSRLTGKTLASVILEKNLYKISEPLLSEKEKEFLEEQEKKLSPSTVSNESLLHSSLQKAAIESLLPWKEERYEYLRYYFVRNKGRYADISVFVEDQKVRRIDVVIGKPVQIFYEGKEYLTNIILDKETMNKIAKKLAHLAGKSISETRPLFSGSIKKNIHVQGTLQTKTTTGKLLIEKK